MVVLTLLVDVTLDKLCKVLDALAVDAVHDNSLNVDEVLFDNTVKDYTDSLNAVVYLQEPESVEDSAFVKGTGLSLYLTTDVTKVPERVEETDSTFTELTVR